MSTPAAPQELRATPLPGGLVLEWVAGAEPERPLPSKWFVVRLRMDAGGRTTLEKTQFLSGRHRAYVDADLAPGKYRYCVGGITEAGSGPHRVLDVAWDEGTYEKFERHAGPGSCAARWWAPQRFRRRVSSSARACGIAPCSSW